MFTKQEAIEKRNSNSPLSIVSDFLASNYNMVFSIEEIIIHTARENRRTNMLEPVCSYKTMKDNLEKMIFAGTVECYFIGGHKCYGWNSEK